MAGGRRGGPGCRCVGLPPHLRALHAACAPRPDRGAAGKRAQSVRGHERSAGDHHLVSGIGAGRGLWFWRGSMVRRDGRYELPRSAATDPERLRIYRFGRGLRQVGRGRTGRCAGVLADTPRDTPRPRNARGRQPRLRACHAPGLAQLDRRLLGRTDACAAGDHGRGQSWLAAAYRDHVSLRKLRRLVAAREHVLPGHCDRPAAEGPMIRSDHRPSLLQRTLGVFVVLAFFLILFLWAGKALVQRPVENVYLDARRLAALRTFERAIVPLKSPRDYAAPTADLLRQQFSFCADPLQERGQGAASARARKVYPCANADPAEELACHLGTINSKLSEMSGDRRANRFLAERYVVSVERWIEAIRTTREQPAAQSAMERRDGKHH